MRASKATACVPPFEGAFRRHLRVKAKILRKETPNHDHQ